MYIIPAVIVSGLIGYTFTETLGWVGILLSLLIAIFLGILAGEAKANR